MGFEIIGNERSLTATEKTIIGRDAGIHAIQEPSDVAQTIKELNDDKIDSDKFSPIDMKARLMEVEISSIIALDSLVAFEFLPQEVSHITRSKKRLSVSIKGQGRQEIVQISQGMKEAQTGKSVWDKIGGAFGGGK